MGWIVGCWCLDGRFACRLASRKPGLLCCVVSLERKGEHDLRAGMQWGMES